MTRDIWLYDSATGSHKNLTARGGEDTNPVAGEGDTFYFLSERDGRTVNVYSASTANPSQATALTDFKTHPVRFLSRANDGRMALTYDGEIYTMMPGSRPVKLAIDVIDDTTPHTAKLPVRTGARGAVPSPDGKSVAFTWRGNVFVTSVEYPTTKQISATPAAESDVCWSPDGKTLYYTSERDGLYNIYKAEMARADEEPDFAHATLINEQPVFPTDKHERTVPQVSPDGNKLAFIV